MQHNNHIFFEIFLFIRTKLRYYNRYLLFYFVSNRMKKTLIYQWKVVDHQFGHFNCALIKNMQKDQEITKTTQETKLKDSPNKARLIKPRIKVRLASIDTISLSKETQARRARKRGSKFKDFRVKWLQDEVRIWWTSECGKCTSEHGW